MPTLEAQSAALADDVEDNVEDHVDAAVETCICCFALGRSFDYTSAPKHEVAGSMAGYYQRRRSRVA